MLNPTLREQEEYATN